MCGVSPLFVYTMSQVQICACTRICIWRMYIIELLSEMVYKVYKSSRSYPTRLYDEPCMDLCLCIRWASERLGKRGGLWKFF